MMTNIPAGFIDAFEREGQFTFNNGYARGINLTIADKNIVDQAAQTFGGHVNEYIRPGAPAHWVPFWEWHLDGSAAAQVIQQILPHLSVKRQQRATQVLNLLTTTIETADPDTNRERILNLHGTGVKPRKIGDTLHLDHLYVERVIKKHNR